MTYEIIIVLRYNLNNNNNSNFIDIRELFAEYYQQKRNIIYSVLSISIKLSILWNAKCVSLVHLGSYRHVNFQKR